MQYSHQMVKDRFQNPKDVRKSLTALVTLKKETFSLLLEDFFLFLSFSWINTGILDVSQIQYQWQNIYKLDVSVF